MYDVSGEAATATPALADRVAALRAWEDSWNALAGGHDGDGGSFWQKRAPDLSIALPPFLWWSPTTARVRHIVATIIDPEPPFEDSEQDDERDGLLDAGNHFLFGPWFITATRSGFNVRASYSYLDLHGCLDRVGEGGEGREGVPSGARGGVHNGKENRDPDRGANYDRVIWTAIKVPVRNVVAFALSTELDLAAVISWVYPFYFLSSQSLN
jgi:hypothetical protein